VVGWGGEGRASRFLAVKEGDGRGDTADVYACESGNCKLVSCKRQNTWRAARCRDQGRERVVSCTACTAWCAPPRGRWTTLRRDGATSAGRSRRCRTWSGRWRRNSTSSTCRWGPASGVGSKRNRGVGGVAGGAHAAEEARDPSGPAGGSLRLQGQPSASRKSTTSRRMDLRKTPLLLELKGELEAPKGQLLRARTHLLLVRRRGGTAGPGLAVPIDSDWSGVARLPGAAWPPGRRGPRGGVAPGAAWPYPKPCRDGLWGMACRRVCARSATWHSAGGRAPRWAGLGLRGGTLTAADGKASGADAAGRAPTSQLAGWPASWLAGG
jgi:hypothetical protein